jgi:hypothetical protein
VKPSSIPRIYYSQPSESAQPSESVKLPQETQPKAYLYHVSFMVQGKRGSVTYNDARMLRWCPMDVDGLAEIRASLLRTTKGAEAVVILFFGLLADAVGE